MSHTHVELWYCCLNPTERLAHQTCAANAGPVTYFLLKTLFDALWITAIEGSASLRSQVFVAEKFMTLGTLPPDDPDGIEVYYLEPTFWDEINAYFDEHGTSCPTPCKIRTFIP